MTQFSGLEPGQMAYVGYSSDSESDEHVSQCVPFNPFSFAMRYDTFVWAILLNNVDDYLQALRPRRVYPGDTAIVLETIEGLAAYPQEVMQGSQSISTGTVCQTIIKRYTHEYRHYEGWPPVYKYSTWWHVWEYEGASISGTITFHFTVPCEYIEWDNGRIEEIIPAKTGFSVSFEYKNSVSDEKGTVEDSSPGYNFPTPRCSSRTYRMKSAGRF
jgi:hypothetical protein